MVNKKEQSDANIAGELSAAQQRIAELEAKLKQYETKQATGVVHDCTNKTMSSPKFAKEQGEPLIKKDKQDLGFYKTLFEQSPLGIIAANLDLEIIEVNKHICQMLGYSVDEFKTLTPTDFTHADDIAESTSLVKRLYNEELDYYRLEKRYIRKDGSIFWGMVTVALVRDEQGKAAYSIGMIEDINERKLAEQKLQASEKRYRDLVSDTLVGVVSSTIDGEALYVNDALLQMLEYDSLEDYQAAGALSKYKYPETRQQLIQQLNESGKVTGMEVEAKTKGGKDISVLLSATLDKGIINFTLVDITARKQAQNLVQEERNMLMTIINNLPFDVYVKDLESRFVIANTATMKTLRVNSAEEYLGKNDLDFIPQDPEQARKNMEAERQITETGEALLNQELSGIDPDGHMRWNLTSKIPLRDAQGKITGIVGIGMDITDRKWADFAMQAALEKEQEMNLLKNRFMAMVSHEFRTPLAIIATSSQLLERYYAKISVEKREEYLQRIEGQVLHLNNMIENINTIMRNEIDPLSLNPTMIDLKALCQTIVDTLQNSIAVDHHLKFSCAEDLGMMMADEGLMRIVISNLLSNAIKYSPAGSEILLEMLESNGWRILRVHDKGIGISQEDIDRLFDAYHRGKNAENIKGIGLGLKIVKDFVELHSGEIDVDSTVNEGTTFTVMLPLNIAKKS